MIDSSANLKYGTIPSSESQANHTDIRSEDSVSAASGGESYPTNEHISTTCRTKWIYFLLGCMILLPFNALFNATPFFLSRLAGSPFRSTFSSCLSSVYTLTKLACQLYCTLTSKRSSRSRRILVSILGMIFVASSLCLSTLSRTSPSTFFAFSLFDAALMAVAASYLSTAVYASAALLGTSFLRPVMAGQATIGVVVSLVQVASSVIALWGSATGPVSTVATGPGGQDDRAGETAARISFGVSAGFLSVTLVSYAWLMRQPSYKESEVGTPNQHSGDRTPDEHTELNGDYRRHASTDNAHVYQVLRKNLVFVFSVIYLFTVTLSVYPVVTARVRPVNPSIHPLLFTAVHFLVMHIGAFIGQASCSFPRLAVWSGKKILALSLLRTLFIPIFLLCNVDRRATSPVSSIIRSDTIFMIIVFILGYSTGYISSMVLLAISSLKHNHRLRGREDVDVAATLGGSCMILGLALGSLASFGVQAML